MNEFLTFQRYNDKALAEELISILKEKDIECEIEDNLSYFDPSYANNEFNKEISIKLRKEDFDEVHDILIEKANTDSEKIDKSYYLFEFTDDELIEIVSKPDEWSHFDYSLSLKLLKERGMEINPNLARTLRKNRIKELSKPETGAKIWIIFGYVSALIGGVIGIFMGLHILTHKKVLPNGDKVYAFEETDRKHAFYMVIVGFVCLVFWISVELFSGFASAIFLY
jgi:hypothetical protein